MGTKKKIQGCKVGGDFSISYKVTQVKIMILHTMYNRKSPSSSGECGVPQVLSSTSWHHLGAKQAELLATLGRTGRKDRDGDGEEQRKGRKERRFLYGNMEEGQKGQKEMTGEGPSYSGNRRSHGTAQQRCHFRAPRWDISDPHPCSVCSATKKG